MSQDPTEGGGASFRAQRLRWSWILALPYLLLARPSPGSLIAGALITVPGLLLRSWAAGFIHKEVALATDGPYRIIRHPLYAGSFLLGLGLAVASGRWWFVPAFGLLFAGVYGRTVRAENRLLEARFGQDYTAYRDRVGAFLPRRPSRPGAWGAPPSRPGPEARSRLGSGPQAGRFRWEAGARPWGFRPRLYGQNKEWQAALGLLVGFALLWIKMNWLG